MKRNIFLVAIFALLSVATMSGQRLNAPSAANLQLESNQLIMGHYNTDSVLIGGNKGLIQFTGTRPIGTILEPSEIEPFQGGKIVAFRVGIAESTPVTRVFVAPVVNGEIGEATEWSCNVSNAGWNTVTLATPYEINLGSDVSLMIGFDYEQTKTNHPISYVNVGTLYPTYSYITYNGNTSWMDINLTSYGNLCVQCIVESDYFDSIKLLLSDLTMAETAQLSDGSLPFTFKARNQGTSELKAGTYTFDYSVDGTPMGTITGEVTLGSIWTEFAGCINFANLQPGGHTFTISTATVNGQAIAADDVATLTQDFIIFSKLYPRQKRLVEQFTSNTCTYCPLGSGFLETLANLRGDVAWASVHGVQNKSNPDPYNNTQCDSIAKYAGLTGWPEAAIDRMANWYQEGTIMGVISFSESDYAEYASALSDMMNAAADSMPTYASINISSTIDRQTRKATIMAYGNTVEEFDKLLGDDTRITIYLTEDSLISPQYNQGTWINEYVHNNVLRQALPGVMGEAINAVSNAYQHTYTVTIPDEWNIDNLNVIAFISRPIEGSDVLDKNVNNAEVVKLGNTLMGDVNRDGKISISDVTALINYVLDHDASGIDLLAGDTDGNGTISISDVTALINYVLSGSW